jgi:nuclear transport factor 2 (NTF2) superfamily protein
MSQRPPRPPFTRETAIQKIRAAEDAWNSRDPDRCAGAYTRGSRWRFTADGLMAERHASMNDVAIDEGERPFHWDRSGPRPDDHPGMSQLGL